MGGVANADAAEKELLDKDKPGDSEVPPVPSPNTDEPPAPEPEKAGA